MAPLRIVVSGVTGRMGQALVALIGEAEDLTLVGGIAEHAASGEAARRHGVERIVRPAEAADLIGSADAVIDFSSPAGLGELLGQKDALGGRPLVVGTTGLGAAHEQALEVVAARGPVFVASNFSVGVHVLGRLVAEAARLLAAGAWDTEIVETHHRAKVDAPSGTALTLARAVAESRGVEPEAVRRDGRSGMTGERPAGEIGMHALRGGGVIGEHHVHFLGDRERIELVHVATDRALFAAGALAATRWAAGQPAGWYGMANLVGRR